jgi:DedD protein
VTFQDALDSRPSIPMQESRLKERLTGAVILVALIVLLVPELLSGPGVTAQPTRTTDEDGAPMRSYTIDLADDGGAPRPTTGGESTTEFQPLGAQDDAAESEAGEAAAVQPDETPVASAESETPAAAEDTQSAAIEESTPAPVAETPPAPVAEPPARASPPVSGWMVQVGSFASRQNAERLARELKSKGFAASVSESRGGGRNLYRVRVGPEADRAAAQAVLAKLRARGQRGAALMPYP